MYKKIFATISLVGIGIVGRLVPHVPNATPISAISLMGSKHIGRMWAVAIPIIAMIFSDAIIGFYNWKILVSVYISFVLIGLLSAFTKKYPGLVPTSFVLVGSSVIFFIVTNFTVWLCSPWYAKNIGGLLYAYELGLPFFRNMVVGDVVYAASLFGVFEVVRRISVNRLYRLAGGVALLKKEEIL